MLHKECHCCSCCCCHYICMKKVWSHAIRLKVVLLFILLINTAHQHHWDAAFAATQMHCMMHSCINFIFRRQPARHEASRGCQRNFRLQEHAWLRCWHWIFIFSVWFLLSHWYGCAICCLDPCSCHAILGSLALFKVICRFDKVQW